MREDYNKLKEQVRKGKEPPIQDKMKKGIVDKPITQDIDRRSPPRLTDKVRQIEADNLEVKDSKPRGEILDRPKMKPPNMVQLLKEKKPVPYQNKEGQFKLIQPTDKNIQKIEKIIQEDGKLDPLKMKDIVDFDVKDLKEMDIILAKNKNLNNTKGREKVANMIKVASLTRRGFVAGDISTVMSPRTVLNWVSNSQIFSDTGYAFRVTFLNKCDDAEKNIIAEYYQRCFGEDLPESMINIQI